MSLLDTQTLVSGVWSNTGIAGQAITATAVSTDSYDIAVSRDIGAGSDINFLVKTVAAFNLLTSLTIELITATDGALTAGIVVQQSRTILLAGLTANTTIWQGMVPSNATYGRYVGFRYTVTGTNPSTGSIVAGFNLNNQTNLLGAA